MLFRHGRKQNATVHSKPFFSTLAVLEALRRNFAFGVSKNVANPWYFNFRLTPTYFV